MGRMNGKFSAEARASALGMVCNLLLAAGKIAAGAVTGLLSVLADGVNNLSDCASSVVALISFRVAQKPADREHPYGHRRAEYVASMCIAFLVLVLAVEFARESLDKIVAGTESASVWWVYLVLGISVFVKACMFVGYRVVAKKTDCALRRQIPHATVLRRSPCLRVRFCRSLRAFQPMAGWGSLSQFSLAGRA